LKQILAPEKILGEIPFHVKRVYMKAILKIYVVGEVNYEGFGCDEIESILENLAFE